MQSKTIKALFSPKEVQNITHGSLVFQGTGEIQSVGIDSRELLKGSLFIPLAGTKVDGHQFLEQAIRKGAAAVLSAESEWKKQKDTFISLLHDSGASMIIVEDTLKALQDLANYHMRRHPEVVRIGITGSNGKTTTKEIIGAILSEEAKTSISEGNLNSEIGLPLSAFKVEENDHFAVFEMGMNHEGEMDALTNIIRPDFAVITNIGSAHIGLLGSQKAIAREKRKIFNFFNGNQKAFLYEEEKFYKYLSRGLIGKVIPFGPNSTPGFEGSQSLGLDGTSIHWEGLQIRFPLLGFHNLLNALSSISVSVELGINSSIIKSGLEKVKPLFGRSQVLRGGVSIIQDCYNSNPDSVLQLLDFFKTLEWKGRKIAILGSMLELGENCDAAHRHIGLKAARSGFDKIYLFGAEMESASKALKQEEFLSFHWTADFDHLRTLLIDQIKPGDLILLKGSRGVELERLIPYLKKGNSGG